MNTDPRLCGTLPEPDSNSAALEGTQQATSGQLLDAYNIVIAAHLGQHEALAHSAGAGGALAD